MMVLGIPDTVLSLGGTALLVLCSYAGGSLLGADLVGRLRGFSARVAGSGNPGATNVYRVAGFFPAVVVFLWDGGKGWILTRLPYWCAIPSVQTVACVCFLAVLVGHVHPLWHRRHQGGKGVATFLGGILALAPFAALIFAIVWLISLRWTRFVSLASLVAGGTATATWLIVMGTKNGPILWMTAFLSYALLVWRHKENIKRLLKGVEPRIRGGDEGHAGG